MKLPRDVSGAALVAALRRLGYEKVRQRGSYVRITTQEYGVYVLHEIDATPPRCTCSSLE